MPGNNLVLPLLCRDRIGKQQPDQAHMPTAMVSHPAATAVHRDMTLTQDSSNWYAWQHTLCCHCCCRDITLTQDFDEEVEGLTCR
jgi:hypothetical protein